MKRLLVILLVPILALNVARGQSPRIAIIGGGIGGTSVAHFLKKAMPNVHLSIFEANKDIGGRLKTVDLAGKTYECGGKYLAFTYSFRFLNQLIL